MNNYNVSYKTYGVKENTTIPRDLFSCIIFINVGESPATVNNCILQPGTSIEFNEDPNVTINTDFNVIFTPTDPSESQLVNVITSFYKEIGKTN